MTTWWRPPTWPLRRVQPGLLARRSRWRRTACRGAFVARPTADRKLEQTGRLGSWLVRVVLIGDALRCGSCVAILLTCRLDGLWGDGDVVGSVGGADRKSGVDGAACRQPGPGIAGDGWADDDVLVAGDLAAGVAHARQLLGRDARRTQRWPDCGSGDAGAVVLRGGRRWRWKAARIGCGNSSGVTATGAGTSTRTEACRKDWLSIGKLQRRRNRYTKSDRSQLSGPHPEHQLVGAPRSLQNAAPSPNHKSPSNGSWRSVPAEILTMELGVARTV